MSVQDEAAIRFIDFHRSPHRRDYFGRERPGIFFDPTLNRWIVDSAPLAADVLGDQRFLTSDYEGVCRHMAAAGQPVESLALAYANIPLCHDGERHRALRRSMSEHLAARRKEIVPDIAAIIAPHLAPLAQPGKVEVMTGILAPVVDAFLGRIVDVVVEDKQALAALSPAFDHAMGARKLVQTDGEIGKVREAIRRSLPDDRQDAEGRHLALLMLGRDPLLGSLGESLRHIFETGSGRSTAEMDFASAPPETGVPYIERIAGEDCRIAGVEIPRGERLRIMLQAFSYSQEERDRLRIFGVGTHACLGRPLALDLWKAMTDMLRAMAIRIRYEGSTPRTTDYVFTCPRYLNIEVLNDTPGNPSSDRERA
jgi:cytochrome P450